MTLSLETVLYILYSFTALSLLMLLLLLLLRQITSRNLSVRQTEIRELLLDIVNGTRDLNDLYSYPRRAIKPKFLLDQMQAVSQSVKFDNDIFYDIFQRLDNRLIPGLFRQLDSRFKFRRIAAANSLGLFKYWLIQNRLQEAFRSEHSYTVKRYLAHILADYDNLQIIPDLIESLANAPPAYRNFIDSTIAGFGQRAEQYILPLLSNDSPVYLDLVLEFSKVYLSDGLEQYLIRLAHGPDSDLALKIVKVIFSHHRHLLADAQFITHENREIAGYAIQALSDNPNEKSFRQLVYFLRDPDVSADSVVGLSALLRANPDLLQLAVKQFQNEDDPEIRNLLAKVLSFRIEYFILSLKSKSNATIMALISDILGLGQSSAVVGFLNSNQDLELEDRLVDIIAAVLKKHPNLAGEYQEYLDENILIKLQLEKQTAVSDRQAEQRDPATVRLLNITLLGALLIVPLIHLIANWNILGTAEPLELLKGFVIRFNYLLIYYSTSINSLYLIILLVSAAGIFLQQRYWKLKNYRFLNRPGVLPSISIIAPAYNEEANIIESVNSLLNLRYPDYELLVVSDGSSDGTLQRLKDYFSLEKIDIKQEKSIETMPVRGIYANKLIPQLKVIDKANGGKADSLNVGINLAHNEFVCGIDADSLLEEEALMKLASGMVDSDDEGVAAGGNILPVNGCQVSHGHLTKINIPANRIALFQTIEYIRAFMAGRVGWSQLRSLLIISGAFGLFRRRRIIEIGGYLTASGIYHKDTVGEDMELVVRLSRHMREQGIRHRVYYIFNANCWTEVPESMNILYRQRDRWQRGLIDILTFHRKIIFRPRYGTTGLIGLPYFLVFEAIGPLFEIQGYLMVVAAAFLGLLNIKIALLLFISTILMGIFISITALLIAGNEVNRFSLKEVLVLVFYAIIENFGFRQFLSLLRVNGYISSLKKPKGWGKMVRKGIGQTA